MSEATQEYSPVETESVLLFHPKGEEEHNYLRAIIPDIDCVSLLNTHSEFGVGIIPYKDSFWIIALHDQIRREVDQISDSLQVLQYLLLFEVGAEQKDVYPWVEFLVEMWNAGEEGKVRNRVEVIDTYRYSRHAMQSDRISRVNGSLSFMEKQIIENDIKAAEQQGFQITVEQVYQAIDSFLQQHHEAEEVTSAELQVEKSPQQMSLEPEVKDLTAPTNVPTLLPQVIQPTYQPMTFAGFSPNKEEHLSQSKY